MTIRSRSQPESAFKRATAWLFAQGRRGLPRSSVRMGALIELLGLTTPNAVVHVVGTNGKGTVATMVAAGLAASGSRVGLFLSPHVEHFSERIAVAGRPINEQEVTAFAEALIGMRLERRFTFFELTLAMALDHFAGAKVDVAVVEAGVGARHDATNALGNVILCVITNVGRDHVATLGPRLIDIASDKADAIRPGRPVVTGVRGPPARVVAAVAAKRGSPLHSVTSKDALYELPRHALTPRAPFVAHLDNTRLAAGAMRLLGLPCDAVIAGLSAPPLPARRERFLVAGEEVVLDGAHNPSAARSLVRCLPKPYVLVFAAQPRKLGEDTLRVLEPHARAIIVTTTGAEPSSLLPSPKRVFIADPVDALDVALAHRLGPVVIAGSFYLAGRLRPLLASRAATCAPAPDAMAGKESPRDDSRNRACVNW